MEGSLIGECLDYLGSLERGSKLPHSKHIVRSS